MFTLHQDQINGIKCYMAGIDGRLREDISDAEVFDFIDDVYEMDKHFDICMMEKGYPNKKQPPMLMFSHQAGTEPRTKQEIVQEFTLFM